MEEIKEQGEIKSKKKKPFWKRALGGFLTLILIIAGVIVVYKGSTYILYKQDPVYNNHAAVKAKKYDSVYSGLSDILVIFDIAGNAGKEFAAEHIVPFVDKRMLDEEKEVLTNETLVPILKTEYTIKDEDTVAGYTGRKVKLTGNIGWVDEESKTASLILDPKMDSYKLDEIYSTTEDEAGWPSVISFGYGLLTDASPIFLNSCVEIEGILIMNPDDFSDPKWRMDKVIVKSVKTLDFVEQGGDPAEQYLHQPLVEMEKELSAEGKNLDIEVKGVLVDEKTGNAVVKYVLNYESGQQDRHIQAYAAKENKDGEKAVPAVWSGTVEDSIAIKTGGSTIYGGGPGKLAEEIKPESDHISLIVCGYNITDEMKIDEETEVIKDKNGDIIKETPIYSYNIPDGINPDADMYVRIDIPKEYWSIYKG